MHFLNPGEFCYYIYDKYYLSSVLGGEPMTSVLLDQYCTAELLQQSNCFYKDTQCTCLYINLKYFICSCVKKWWVWQHSCKMCFAYFYWCEDLLYFFLCIQYSYWKYTWWVFTIFFTGSLIFFLLFKLKKMEQQQQVGDVLEFI